MKKRKREDNMSLDSLLDTMTTVVGILIILYRQVDNLFWWTLDGSNL